MFDLCKKTILVCLALNLMQFSACTISDGNPIIADDTVMSRIQEGRTKKQEVRRMFGEPESVEFPAAASERWTYIYYSSHIGFHNFIPFVGLVTSGTDSNKMYTFEINFARNGVVKDYSWTRSHGEVRKLLD